MGLRIEDYALIGNMRTAALVGRNGSIDWLCAPRFDSAACFAALLGTSENGHWSIAPKGDFRVNRRYRERTLILETEFLTSTGRPNWSTSCQLPSVVINSTWSGL